MTATAPSYIAPHLMHLHRASVKPNRRNHHELLVCMCGKRFRGEARLQNHQAACCAVNPADVRTCDVCGKACPAGTRTCVIHTFREIDFLVCDVLIARGWGDVRQLAIPADVMKSARAEAEAIAERRA